MSTKEIFYFQRYNRLKLMLGKSYIIQTQEIWRGSANIRWSRLVNWKEVRIMFYKNKMLSLSGRHNNYIHVWT